MSHPVNTILAEDALQQFEENRDGEFRAGLMQDLRNKGMGGLADELLEIWYDERHKYIENAGIQKKDVLSDDDGEYYMSETDNGNPGEEGYDVKWKKIRMPTYLDIDLWLHR